MSADKEKTDTNKMNSQLKHVPKDAQVIMSILKELNVKEYEPRVVNQLLDFTYRYVTCLLDDAKVFAHHASKKNVDLEDVQVAIEFVLDKTFTRPPARHVLAQLAEVRNNMPLPLVRPHCGLRLPPDRYCLSACNYKLRSSQPLKRIPQTEGRPHTKTQSKPPPLVPTNVNIVKRAPTLPSKAQLVTIPKPIIKFSPQIKTITIDPKDVKMTTKNPSVNISSKAKKMDTEMEKPSTSANALLRAKGYKREHEDDFQFASKFK